jgi:hypothetical protein
MRKGKVKGGKEKVMKGRLRETTTRIRPRGG